MNQKHRLMCESWVEKRPEISQITAHGTASRKQTVKWKTRYAMLIVSCETRTSEIRFYQKKPRTYTEITDDIIKLEPWQYIVDIPSWIVDKGRPHVLRLRLLPESVVPGQHFRIQIAYQSTEETTAWMRCIQNQTKLTSGIQGHSFGVVAEDSSATARIGIAGKHCLLFVSPHKVILAQKTDHSVVCVWPFETIRSFASDDDRRLVVEAGRCAPLGEGVYSFRTRENDDNVIFDLFDHYTAEAAEEPDPLKTKNKPSQAHSISQDQSKSAPANVPSLLESSNKSRKAEKKVGKPKGNRKDEPPEKPPLPENRATISLVSNQPRASQQTAVGKINSSPVLAKKSIDSMDSNLKGKTKAGGSKEDRNSVSKGLYDLDKLLYNLESTINSSRENLDQIETPSYDMPPSPQVAEKHFDSDKCVKTKENIPELAYSINTIKLDKCELLPNIEGVDIDSTTDLEKPVKIDSASEDLSPISPISPYDNLTPTEKDMTPTRPKIAPKPPSFKLSAFPTKGSTTEIGPAGTVPYAKVDPSKKKI